MSHTVLEEQSLRKTPWSYRAAAAVAYVFSPLLFPPLLFGLVLAHFGAPATEIGWMLGLVGIFFVGVPLGYTLHLLYQHRIDSLELPRRQQRVRPLLVGILSYLLALAFAATTGETAVALVTAIVACHAVNALLILLVSLRWKISVHTSAAAGFASVLLFVAHTAWPTLADRPPETLLLQPLPLATFLLLVPLLMWARVRTGAHTQSQAAAGALFGLAVPYGELYLLLKLGLLTGV